MDSTIEAAAHYGWLRLFVMQLMTLVAAFSRTAISDDTGCGVRLKSSHLCSVELGLICIYEANLNIYSWKLHLHDSTEVWGVDRSKDWLASGGVN